MEIVDLIEMSKTLKQKSINEFVKFRQEVSKKSRGELILYCNYNHPSVSVRPKDTKTQIITKMAK